MRAFRFAARAWVGLLVAVVSLGGGAVVNASGPRQQSNGTATITMADVGASDLTLQGLDGRDSVYFPLPSNMTEATPAQLVIIYQASPLLDPQRASLTILANNLTLTSIHPAVDGKDHTIQVEIPPSELQDTEIRIQFIGSLDLAGDVACPHDNDPGQWLTIKNTSALQLSPQDNVLQPFLNQLPTIIAVSNPLGVRPPVIFVVPDNPTATDLTVAARVAARFGDTTDHGLFPYQVETASSLNSLERTQANLVVIGVPGKQPIITELAAGLPIPLNGTSYGAAGGSPLTGSVAVVQIFNSPTNPARKVLLVSGTDDTGLALAGSGFADAETYRILAGKTQYAVFDKLAGTAVSTSSEAWTTDTTSLAALGFGDETLNGLGVEETTLYISRPLGWLLEPGSQLTLHMVNSPALDPKSHLTVSINNEPVGTYPIDDTNNDKYVTFQLPDSVIGGAATGGTLHSLNIKLSARMFLDTKSCTASDPTAAWMTVVASDSTLDTQHLNMVMPDLQAYPYPFLTTTPSDTSTAIILPSSPDTTALSQGISLATSLGNSARSTFHLEMMTYDQSQQSTSVANSNLIVMGVEGQQPMVKDLFEQLGNDSSLAVDALNTSGTGILLETISPLNGERTALLVTGQTKDAFVNAAASLFDAAPPVTQPGSLAVVQPAQSPHVIYKAVDQPANAPAPIGQPTAIGAATQPAVIVTASPAGTPVPAKEAAFNFGSGQLVAIIVAPLLIIGMVAVVWTVWSRRSARSTVGISDVVANNKDVFPATVLVIEDDKSSNRLVQKHLVMAGFEVEVAYDGISGIQIAKSKKPDLVILDAMMPDMDGYETARRIRALEGMADVPIVMLTALSTIDHKVQAFEAGINEYMTKPFDGTELVMRAITLLKRG